MKLTTSNFLAASRGTFYPIILLLALWIIVQGFLLWQNGIFVTLEAEKYISQAQYFLANGDLESKNYWLYSTEIFLIAAAIKLHAGFTVVAIIQLLLNLFSTWMFYKLAMHFLKNSLLTLLAVVFFIINIPYQVYNTFLFTESIFYSLTIIYSSYLFRINKLTTKRLFVISLLLVLLSVTRPTGILFFFVTALYIFFRFLYNTLFWQKVVIICGAIIIFLFAINVMLQVGGSLDFMQPFRKENIICGVPTTSNAQIKTLEKGNSLKGLLYYIFNNEKQFLRLGVLKTVSFFGLTRNYYSRLHNIYLVLFFYPFYLLAFWGIWKTFKRKDPVFYYMFVIILLYWVTTLLTCDDWHNRFILTVTPFIFLIALGAFAKDDVIKS